MGHRTRLGTRATLAALVVGLALALAACGGDGDSAAAGTTTAGAATVASAPGASADEQLLIDTLDAALARIEGITARGGECDDPDCVLDAVVEMGDLADEQLVELRRMVARAHTPCLIRAGRWYALALGRWRLARDEELDGDFALATVDLRKANEALEESARELTGCRPAAG